MRVAGLIILIFGYWLTVNGLEAEVILSSYFLRGINAQESVDAVGDAGITPYEENGYLSLWARGRDDMMTVTYKVSGVDRSSQSVRITVSYDGEGLLGVKNFSESSGDRLWTDKYLLPKRDRGTKTINVSTSAHTDWRGRMEIYVSVSNDQFITVKSLEVQALDIEPVVRVVREYRYFPDTYYYTVAHWQYRWGPIYVWGPYGYVCYRYWWESPWYVSWYDHYYRTVVVYHPIRYHHYYDYVGQVVVVRDSSSDPPRKIIQRQPPERRIRSAAANRNLREARDRDENQDTMGSLSQREVAPKKTRRAADIETKTSDERRLAPTRTEPQRQVEERVGKFKIRRTDGSGSVSTNLAPSQQVERQTTQDETVGRFKIRRSSTDFSIEQRSGSSGTSSYSQPTYSAPNREASRSYSQSEIKRRPSQDSVRTSPQEVRSRSQEVRIEVRRESRTESHSSPVPTKTRREEMRSAPTPQPRPAPSVSSSSVKKMREKNKDDETR